MGLVVGFTYLVVVPCPSRACAQEPCPQLVKSTIGMVPIMIVLVLALVAMGVVFWKKLAWAEVPVVVLSGLALIGVGLPRFIGLIGDVRADPGMVLVQRWEAIGPLDYLSVLIGLALVITSMLVWATLGRRRRLTEHRSLPVLVGGGFTIAAIALAMVAFVPEMALSGQFLEGQLSRPGWYPPDNLGISMPAGARNASLLLLLMVPLLGVASQAWASAGRTASRVKSIAYGLAGAAITGAFVLIHDVLVRLQQTFIGLYTGPFAGAALEAITTLAMAMVACALVAGFWPSSEPEVPEVPESPAPDAVEEPPATAAK